MKLNGSWKDVETNNSIEDELVRYSKMKHGCPIEIDYFAKAITNLFLNELAKPGIIKKIISQASQKKENICMMLPGSRNIPSSSNLVFEKALDYINITMSNKGFPTIVNIPLIRLKTSQSDYAQLSEKDRKDHLDETKTILPENNFFTKNVHTLFCDDIEITGSTKNRYKTHVEKYNGKSFSFISLLRIDNSQIQHPPHVEDEINHYFIPKKIDSSIINIINHPDFIPVQRMIKLLLLPENIKTLKILAENDFSDDSLKKITLKILGNDFLYQKKYSKSAKMLYEIACSRNEIFSLFS